MFKNNNNKNCLLSLQTNGNATVARSTSKAESENKNDGISPPKPKVIYFRKFAFLHEKKSAILLPFTCVNFYNWFISYYRWPTLAYLPLKWVTKVYVKQDLVCLTLETPAILIQLCKPFFTHLRYITIWLVGHILQNAQVPSVEMDSFRTAQFVL